MIMRWDTALNERPLATWTDRWRLMVPALTCLVGAFLMTLPVITPGPAMPNLPLLAVLIWSLFQPSLMPPYAALPIGVLTDAVLGLPIGINAALMPALVIVIGMLDSRFGHRRYALDWIVSAMLIGAYQYLAWQFLGFARRAELPVGSLWAQTLATVLAYPCAMALIGRMQRRWGEPA